MRVHDEQKDPPLTVEDGGSSSRSSGNRRSRRRESTLAEIHAAARRLLMEKGPEALTSAAIAHALGITPPALYRYYPSHERLVEALAAEYYAELTERIAEARNSSRRSGQSGTALMVMCRAMRLWGLSNPGVFRLLFTSPILRRTSVASDAGSQFGGVFLEEVTALWNENGFPAPDPETLSSDLKRQLADYSGRIGSQLPPEALQVFLTQWVLIYGALSMEILHQIDFAFDNPEPLYEACVSNACSAVGATYREPESI